MVSVITWPDLTTIPAKSSGDTSCITYPPSPLINVGKYGVFSNEKGKNHLIINIESGGRGELAWCPNSSVWYYLKEEFKEEGIYTVSRVQLTSAAKTKQHAMASLTWLMPLSYLAHRAGAYPAFRSMKRLGALENMTISTPLEGWLIQAKQK